MSVTDKMIHPEVYKLDSKGKLRVWYVESDPRQGYRVIAGLADGKKAVSKFKAVTAKNIGKANETSVTEQIEKEVTALYEKQVKTEGYHYNVEDAGKGKSYFAPMLAEKYLKPTVKPVYGQCKLDGFRCLVYDDRIHSREGEPYLSVPHIVDAMEALKQKFPSYVFDGELYHHYLKDDFSKLQSLLTKRVNLTDADYAQTQKFVQYHVYDVFDRDEPARPYKDRVTILADIQEFFSEHICMVPTNYLESHEEVLSNYNHWLSLGYEGQMIRDPDAPYGVDRRSKGLMKHKPVFDGEFEILAINEGVGNWAGAAKTITVKDRETGLITDAGVAGKREDNTVILENAQDYIGTLVTVEHFGITKYNKLRFPVVKVFWKDTERRY